MPLLLLLLAVPALLLLLVLLIPFGLVQRYRFGTARQRARPWLATMNGFLYLFSAFLLLLSAAVANLWASNTLAYSFVGFAAGGLLAVVGLWLTRFDYSQQKLYFRPNRWLVGGLLAIVAARILYGIWLTLTAVGAASNEGLLARAGVAGSMSAAGVFLGYYVIYWFGVRRQFARQTYPRTL